MKALRVIHGLLAGVLALALVAGCQKSEQPGNYQEYSTLKNVGDPAAALVKFSQQEIPPPAVAEKPDQPAIAQASYERLPINQTEPVSTNATPVNPPQPTIAKTVGEPREIKLLIPEKRFTKADRAGTLQVSYDDIDLLKILNMDPVPLDVIDYLPDWLEQLEGQRIRLRGFMYPAFQETGLRGFVLARDNQICCFGRDPKVYDLVNVRLREGTTTDYLPKVPFDVVGTFHILPPEPDEKVLFRLYEIRDAAVITGRSR